MRHAHYPTQHQQSPPSRTKRTTKRTTGNPTMLSHLVSACVLALAVTQASSHTIYSALSSTGAGAVARKQRFDLQQLRGVRAVFLNEEEQKSFLSSSCGEAAIRTWDALDGEKFASIKAELFKWCALSTATPTESVGFLDSSSPILSLESLAKIIQEKKSVAILDESFQEKRIHGTYIQLAKGEITLPRKMLEFLIQHDRDLLQKHSPLISQALYHLMEPNAKDWYFLSLQCRRDPKDNSNDTCAPAAGYCCSVADRSSDSTIFLTRHFILPHQIVSHDLPSSYGGLAPEADQAYVSTITVQSFSKPEDAAETPNFYQILKEKNCLPSSDDCTKCLREKNGANCHSCKKHCGCFCKALCSTKIPPKHVAQEWTITLPQYSKDPHRLIPKIVHQTWFEDLEATKYPNMSRMVESFKQSGWEYRFYSDESAEEFLSTHFPPAVLEAYRAIKPGAFKADLFRYCVLLIHGGIYADVDIQLESVLDVSIPADVGFMPGIPVKKQMCLWNGLIAAAPGHPFLAKAVETVVNQVRNRFTSVDVDATFCPNPEISILHAYDTLFTAGPCLLGASLNRVMGRNGQQSHVPGEVHELWTGDQRERSVKGTSFVRGIDQEDSIHHRIPGRTVILHQNKWDMGAHRFTFLEQNLVIAATDLPDSNDLDKDKPEGEEEHEHYSKTHAKTGIYGLQHLYTDDHRANEDIRIVVDASLYLEKQKLSLV